MQEQCPHCGGFWVAPSPGRVGGVWRVLAAVWLGLCLIYTAINVIIAVWIGGLSTTYLVVFSVGAVAVAALPLLIIATIDRRREMSTRWRQCRSCGYRWTV